MIAGAATMPVLRPLLLAAGFGGVTSWDRRDAVTFPLRWITRHAEALVDLLGCTRELAETASDHPELIIITPDRTWARLAFEAAIEMMIAAIHEAQPTGTRFASCKLADGLTFLNVLELADSVENPMPGIPECRAFQQQLPSWAAEPPAPQSVTLVGSYQLFR